MIILAGILFGMFLIYTEGYLLLKPGFYWLCSGVLNMLAVGLGSGVFFIILAIILKIFWR